MVKQRVGDITKPVDADVWPHEERTAKALAKAGHDVTFIKKSDVDYRHTPDVLIDGELWEFKSPTASNARAIERNMHRALKQAPRVIIDSSRMKDLPDAVVERELRKLAAKMPACKRLVLVNKRGGLVDIK